LLFLFFIDTNLAATTYAYEKMADTVSQNCDSPSPIGSIGPSAFQYYIFYPPRVVTKCVE